MNKTNIEYCQYTLNPIVGCYHNCSYCYARKLVEGRLAKLYPHGFNHIYWHPERLDELKRKKPALIFMNNMSDMFCEGIRIEYINECLSAIEMNPQHKVILLTKNSNRLIRCNPYPKNVILGVTVTKRDEMSRIDDLLKTNAKIKMVSFEPLLETGVVLKAEALKKVDWIILGTQTNPYIGIVRVTILLFKDFCKKHNIPLFMKSSIKKCWDGELIQEYPESLKEFKK